jgi:hypothetical protein
MPAKTNTPASLGGTANSPDEREPNRAMKDLAMAHTAHPPRAHSVVPAEARTQSLPLAKAGRQALDPRLLRPEVEAILLDPVPPAARRSCSLSAPWGGEGWGEVGAAPGPKQPPQAVSCSAAAATLPRAISPREILFVDPGVADIATLLGHLRPEVEAILLDPVRPATHQMAAALAGRHGLDSVHIIRTAPRAMSISPPATGRPRHWRKRPRTSP